MCNYVIQLAARTARFWVWENGGWVKLSLRKGECTEFHESSAHEEGYSWRTCSYEFDGEFVTRCTATGGRDCDGPHSTWNESVCHITALNTRAPYVPRDPREASEDYSPGPLALLPEWEKVNSRQRDYYAESAGY